jgi:hypothetical protein
MNTLRYFQANTYGGLQICDLDIKSSNPQFFLTLTDSQVKSSASLRSALKNKKILEYKVVTSKNHKNCEKHDFLRTSDQTRYCKNCGMLLTLCTYNLEEWTKIDNNWEEHKESICKRDNTYRNPVCRKINK